MPAIAVIRGDGIGPEVVDVALRVLEAVTTGDGPDSFRTETFPWGSRAHAAHGRDARPRRARSSRRGSTRSSSARSAATRSPITSRSGGCGWRSSRDSTRRSACARPSCCRACEARSPVADPRTSTSSSSARTPRVSTRASAASRAGGLPGEVALQTSVYKPVRRSSAPRATPSSSPPLVRRGAWPA